jgi:hypothetical protein
MVMEAFSTDELAGMQATQESAMMDVCDILRMANGGADSYGKSRRVWFTIYGEVPCGFGYPSPRESLGLAQVPQVDATLRLPLETDITNLDRITVTHRFGVEEADPATYELAGPIKQGPSGIQIGMRRVTNA